MSQQSHANARSRRSRYRSLIVTAALAPPLMLMMSGIAQATTKHLVAKPVSFSASAAVSLPSCSTSTLCAFQNSGYGGTHWNYSYSNRPHDTWFYVGSAANDQISSYYNHRAWTSWFAKDCPSTNDTWYVPGGEAVSNLAGLFYLDNTPINDSFSAVGLMSSASPNYVFPAHGAC